VLSVLYRDGALNALLRNRVLQFAGMISYSLYLWQEVFTAQGGFYLAGSWLTVPPLMFVAAALSYYCIERPCIRAGRLLLARRRGRLATAALPIPDQGANEKAIAG
jgi:peptidoglycan/LPS O-acetylase OafA/YrhL